ncbi:hypothetical protein [Candidatus Stoquefichus massiliensis]|uniref:hypothetical protein n=1 Tax=Candidatus Stoquefichus massiliensis TaxID=1470350 RepID=UPI0004829095|nr:hypothetical protein [Candidatus Stoquefichus massiliensis]
MSFIDIIVIMVLGVCIILAIKGIRRYECHDCSRCHKKCGGKYDGKEFRNVIKNQRDTID